MLFHRKKSVIPPFAITAITCAITEILPATYLNQSFADLVIAVIAKINKNIRIGLKSHGTPILAHRGTPPCESRK